MTATARFLILLAVLGVCAGGLGLLRCEGTPPEVAIEGPIFLGKQAREIAFTARDPGSGLRHVEVILETAEGARTVLETRAESGWLLGTAGDDAGESSFLLSAQGLRDGDGTLRIRATDWSWAGTFAGNTAEAAVPVTIDTRPPRIQVESGLTYVKRAGSAAVTYRLDAPAVRDGVQVGETFFQGFPTGADDPERRIAVFAVPRDFEGTPEIRVTATDLAGNVASRAFAADFQDRSFEQVPVRLPERFFEQKVPELAETLGIDPSDVTAAFQTINEKVRAENEARIHEITRGASEPRHFVGGFLQMRNSQVTSRFAEARSYRWNGSEISRATHYGYDLAATARAPVGATNTGRVLFADDLGIYGQCVILDHGLGVTSLYGHLSRIDVEVGDVVEKGQPVGTSGATGLAGGDHLHFAILVGGVYVDPLEWWDASWVDKRIEARILGAAP
ncbi:MAG: M23 family metallopeptidase [Myxococcales bacterium]|nr:M23 family metallopeptidase [Myxococcales bacterium]